MKTLLEDVALAGEDRGFGPDPVLMKKKGTPYIDRDIDEFKRKISDKDYMEHAIDRIALELMHFLAR